MTKAVEESKRVFPTVKSVMDWLGKDVEYCPKNGYGGGIYTLVAFIASSEIPNDLLYQEHRHYSARIKDKQANNSYIVVNIGDIKKAVTANGNCP